MDHKTNLTIFKFLIQKFRVVIDNQSSSHDELAMAIKGYSYFAAVSHGSVNLYPGCRVTYIPSSHNSAMQDIHETRRCEVHVSGDDTTD